MSVKSELFQKKLRLFKTAFEQFTGTEPEGVIVFEVEVDRDKNGTTKVIEKVLTHWLH